MTNDERIKAFAMRLDGKTWEEIGDAIHYAPNYIRNDLSQSLRTARRQIKCCYPAIRRVILNQYGSVRAFSDRCGVPLNTLYFIFSGRTNKPNRRTAHAILAATGLTYEEAFRREGE